MTQVQREEAPQEIAKEVRQIIRAARRASLATLDADGGPFSSLIVTATDICGAPITCMSSLARHTANLLRDDRASLLFEAGEGPQDILARARVTVTGRLQPVEEDAAKRRFLAAQPGARSYAGFRDFGFYRMKMDAAHLVAGFGRIHTLSEQLTLAAQDTCTAIADIEEGALEHMNADHADALQLYATVLLGRGGSGWRATGIDPEGIDLANADGHARLSFPAIVGSAEQLRGTLAALAKQARASPGEKA